MTNRTLDEFTEDAAPASDTESDGVTADRNPYRDADIDPSSQRADTADDVDPRKLVGSVSLNEIRWYYRHTIAKTLVDKPVNDAFKNGFELYDDPNQDIRTAMDELDFIQKYKSAQIKARRDGFALLYYILRDESDGAHEPPQNVLDVRALKVITMDDLKQGGVRKDKIADQVSLDPAHFTVRETGVIVNKNPTSPDFNETVGYVLDFNDSDDIDPRVIHADRVDDYVWNEDVDGDLDAEALGQAEGDSVLQPIIHLLRWLKKGNWAAMNTVYRNSAPLGTLNLPDGSGDDEMTNAEAAVSNLNSKSELIFPNSEYDFDMHDMDGALDPEPYFDLVFEQICASTEMTKSVLFGTQAGTVSGSEVDIKNYFNKVERIRQGRFRTDIDRFVQNLHRWSRRNVPKQYGLDWNEMFKLSNADRAEIIRTLANAGSMMVNNFLMAPDEVRDLMNEEWAKIDVDLFLEDMTDAQKEELEWVNFGQRGLKEAEHSETGSEGTEGEEYKSGEGNEQPGQPDQPSSPEAKGNPQKQNGGGMPDGEKTASEDPTSDSAAADADETDETDESIDYEY